MRQILKIAAMLLAATSVMGQTGLSDRVTAPARFGSWRWPIYKLERERVAVALPAPPAIIWGTGATDEQRKPFFSSIELGKDLDGVEVSEVPGATLYAEPVTDVYKSTDLDQRVRIRSKPEPQYTVKARSKEVRGGIVLRALLTGDGRVVNIRVLKSLPYRMTEAAIEAARKIKFDPAVKDGKPVSAWVQLEYHFNIF